MKLARVIAMVVMACSLGCDKKPAPEKAPVVAEPPKPIAPPDAAPAAPPPDAAATPPDAAAPQAAEDDNPRTSELCGEVIVKIVDCHKDKQFLSALNEGVDAKRKAANKHHLKQIVSWRYNDCGSLPTAIEDGGFLDHWSVVAGMPGILDSCGKLGTALQAAGGLFGGDVAN
jgi:hypothetical protein